MTAEQRAELEVLRDLKERLIFFDGGPEVMSWEAAHRHHRDEPYIGCLFCRDQFVLKAERDRYRDVLVEVLDEWVSEPEFSRFRAAAFDEERHAS